QAGATLDLSQPVAVVLVAVLHLLRDDEDPYGIVARLMEPLASGSYLVVSHLARDIQAEQMARMAERVNQTLRGTLVLRDRAEVARFFEGYEMLGPGVSQIEEWPELEGKHVPPNGRESPYYVGIGRKP